MQQTRAEAAAPGGATSATATESGTAVAGSAAKAVALDKQTDRSYKYAHPKQASAVFRPVTYRLVARDRCR